MKRIITISRQCGAAGGELGRRVADKLNIPYYDKDIILNTARASANLTPAEVRRWDERVPHEFGFTQSLFDFYGRPVGERLWQAQVDAVRKMADAESCVIVGRNADWILKEFDHCLKIFVHAELGWRIEHMKGMMAEPTTEEQLRADIKTADKARAAYCEKFTGRRFGNAADFDLTLCTSTLGLDTATEFVLKASEQLARPAL